MSSSRRRGPGCGPAASSANGHIPTTSAPSDLQSIAATFLSVFPEGTLWLVGDGDVLLVGSTEPLEPRLATIAESWRRPGVADDLASVGARDPFQVLSMFVAQGATLGRWAGNAPVQSDDRAALEFSGPANALTRRSADNAALLRALAAAPESAPAVVAAVRAAASPEAIRDRGRMLLDADAARPAYVDFTTALERAPDDALALDGLIRASAQIERAADTRALLTKLAATPTNLHAKLALSRFLAAEGAYDEAVQIPLADAPSGSREHRGPRTARVDSVGPRGCRTDEAGRRQPAAARPGHRGGALLQRLVALPRGPHRPGAGRGPPGAVPEPRACQGP